MSKPKKDIKTREEFDERIRELQDRIKTMAAPFPNDTAEAQLARVMKAKRDPLYFFEIYFPHYVTKPFAKFHKEEVSRISAALNSRDSVVIAEAWSRGFGKSSMLAIMLAIWANMNKLSHYTFEIAADKELAMERTASIRAELQVNARIRQDFPEVAMAEGSGEEHDFVVPNNTRYRAQGYKQGIRGKSFGPHRPRLIIIDDLESHLDTNPKIGDAKLKYVLEEAFGALGDKGGVVVWLGNLTHSGHAISKFFERCQNEPGNKGIKCRKVVSEENGKSNWPEAYPIAKLREIEQVMTSIGYARHYLMKPGIDGDVFKEEWLRFVNPFGLDSRLNHPTRQQVGVRGPQRGNDSLEGGNDKKGGTATARTDGASACARTEGVGFDFKLPSREELLNAPKITFADPSLGNGETNDYKAVVTVAFWGGFYWIMDVAVRKMTIVEMLEYMYEVDGRFKTRHYLEDIFWQKLIREYLPQVAMSKGYTLPIRGHSPRLKKEERILALQPLFQFGHIFHCVAGDDWNRMKEQILGFPNAGNDDGPDALAAAIEMFKHTAMNNNYETISKADRCVMY